MPGPGYRDTAAAEDLTVRLGGEGGLYLFLGGTDMFLIRIVFQRVCPDGTLQTREELVVFRDSLCHRTSREEKCDGPYDAIS